MAVLALVGAGAGVVVGLTRNHHSPPPTQLTADVTATVSTGGQGAVTVSWSNVNGRPGFGTYLLLEDGRLAAVQPAPGSTTLTLDGVSAGSHCYRVAATFRHALPAGLPQPDVAKECVTVP